MHGGGGGRGRRLVVVVAAVVVVHHPEGDVHLLLLLMLPRAAAARHGGERSPAGRPITGDRRRTPTRPARRRRTCVYIPGRGGRSEALGIIRFDSRGRGPGERASGQGNTSIPPH